MNQREKKVFEIEKNIKNQENKLKDFEKTNTKLKQSLEAKVNNFTLKETALNKKEEEFEKLHLKQVSILEKVSSISEEEEERKTSLEKIMRFSKLKKRD